MIDQEAREVAVLMVAGFFGSLVRLVLSPEKCWRSWLLRFVVGITCAVFLGGFIGQLLAKWFSIDSAETAAASGFIIGVSAEQLLAMLQAKIATAKLEK